MRSSLGLAPWVPTLDRLAVIPAGGEQQVELVPAAERPGHPPLRIGATDIRVQPLTPG
jgi:hypothetical protein